MRFPEDLPVPDSYDAVLLDFDGTLVDTAPNHCRAWTAAVNQLTGHQIVLDAKQFSEMFAGRSAQQVAEHFSQLYGHSPIKLFSAAAQAKVSYTDGWHEIGPVVDFALDSHALGKKLSIVTGGDPIGVGHVARHTRIGALNLPVFCPALVHPGRGKPAPDMFLLAAVQHGVDPARCIVLEDADAGLEAAARAGMRGYKVEIN